MCQIDMLKNEYEYRVGAAAQTVQEWENTHQCFKEPTLLTFTIHCYSVWAGHGRSQKVYD